jgi:hypothetical protein
LGRLPSGDEPDAADQLAARHACALCYSGRKILQKSSSPLRREKADTCLCSVRVLLRCSKAPFPTYMISSVGWILRRMTRTAIVHTGFIEK